MPASTIQQQQSLHNIIVKENSITNPRGQEGPEGRWEHTLQGAESGGLRVAEGKEICFSWALNVMLHRDVVVGSFPFMSSLFVLRPWLDSLAQLHEFHQLPHYHASSTGSNSLMLADQLKPFLPLVKHFYIYYWHDGSCFDCVWRPQYSRILPITAAHTRHQPNPLKLFLSHQLLNPTLEFLCSISPVLCPWENEEQWCAL